MRALPTFCLAALTLLSACASDPGRFVKPTATPIEADRGEAEAERMEDGYLRVFVSSNLDATGRGIDFGKPDQRPAMLLISARFGKGTVASFSADSDPEIPVLLYDVQEGRTVSAVVDNALLTEGLLIDPESLSRSPHLQIIVRGVPGDKARWVTDLLQIATAEPLLKYGLDFVPGAGAVTGLSTKLGDLLSEEIKSSNKPWEEKTLLGLRLNQGIAALDGHQFVVMLNPSTIELEAPAPALRRCNKEGAAAGLCLANGEPWQPDQAYVRFELDVTDFRSVKDFLGSGIGCEASDRNWTDFRALLASGQLARRQTRYERHLLARGELLQQIRRAQEDRTGVPYEARLLDFAQQATLLPTPDDAYWTAHFRDRAAQLDQCLRHQAVQGRTQYVTIWDDARALFQRANAYPAWSKALARNKKTDAPVLRDAEDSLREVLRLRALPGLARLPDAQLESLMALESQLTGMLRPGYARIIRAQADSDLPLPEQRKALRALAAQTACDECADLLEARITDIDAAVAAEALAAEQASQAAAAAAAAEAAAAKAATDLTAAPDPGPTDTASTDPGIETAPTPGPTANPTPTPSPVPDPSAPVQQEFSP